MNKCLFGLLIFLAGCSGPRPGAFQSDLDFLRKHDTDLVVLSLGDERVIISPKYQGKVFTSTDSGDNGPSFGWIHYKAFDGPEDAHMNAYGGENRLWLGPEGGRFSLFFPPGSKMEFANWKTPAAFDTEPWNLRLVQDSCVLMTKRMQLINYAGTTLNLTVDRLVVIQSPTDIEQWLSIRHNDSVRMVGYGTVNTLENTGNTAWTDSTGMPCLWLLDMFSPSPATKIIIPYHSAPGDTSKPATTNYFGEIPADRIKFVDSTIWFTADGKSRGKLGVHPTRAKPMMGSYDPINKLLTITLFYVYDTAQYLNQEWNTSKPPFSGDAVNAYNDGPLADGSQMGPFYELESVSPAAFLAPGASLRYLHSVFHFTGPVSALDAICRQSLGVSIAGIQK
jgi:hypothetical protein